MQFRFEASQEYQVRAIESVADLFEGQQRAETELRFAKGVGFAAAPNRLDLTTAELLRNLQAVQKRNGLKPDEELQFIKDKIEVLGGSKKDFRFANFSVEMETGTGKTYVYLRTVLELNRRYGLRKYIIVVPSVAVREGVLKTLEVTEKHLRELYDNVPYRYYVYDSDNLSQVRQFALSDNVEIMVMTIDSFNKATNVIQQATDRLQGGTPIHFIRTARPILILDEPQNMESEIRIKALAGLCPLFALRYSATHRNSYNLTYRLTPFDAYRQGLVKKIEVASVVKEKDENQAFLRLEEVRSEKNTITARITVHQLMKDVTIKEKTITVKPGDDLEAKTQRPEYAGFRISEINYGGQYVKFANGAELTKGETQGADREAIFEAQIRYTIQTHFERQARLRDQGIKVLSLFFIDRVDNYAQEDGVIRKLFYKCFNDLKAKYPEWKDKDPKDVQASYFAQKKRKGGTIEFLETTGKSKEDEAAYELIMKAKERLLSFDEPTCFIFSHSALREGWDNPNVFQICALREVGSERERRQQVGRGVRLAVNQEGERVRDDRVNVLTVVANESYEKYVAELQSEIEKEYGKDGVPPPPANARRRATMRLRKERILNPEFKELWQRIARRTWYSVEIDTEKLLASVLPSLNNAPIYNPRLALAKGAVVVSDDAEMFEAAYQGGTTIELESSARPVPNLIDMMMNLLERTTPPVRLTRRTLIELVKRTTNQQGAIENPQEFATVAVKLLKEKLADQLVEGIRYHPLNEWYEMKQLEETVEGWEEYLVPATNSVYDQVEVDSKVESDFVRALEKRSDVKLYVKLPRWFMVDTPVGGYNPDWAIVVDDTDAHGRVKQRLYLVRETKGSAELDALRWPHEKRKVECGKRHFEGALGIDYKVVKTGRELI